MNNPFSFDSTSTANAIGIQFAQIYLGGYMVGSNWIPPHYGLRRLDKWMKIMPAVSAQPSEVFCFHFSLERHSLWVRSIVRFQCADLWTHTQSGLHVGDSDVCVCVSSRHRQCLKAKNGNKWVMFVTHTLDRIDGNNFWILFLLRPKVEIKLRTCVPPVAVWPGTNYMAQQAHWIEGPFDFIRSSG